jgi:hypothetical protein
MQHQHFIPKSYLRNFAEGDGDGKYFVDAKFKKDSQIKKRLSITDICVSKNIYTLPNSPADDKFKLEKFYAANVDQIYPEVYALLINPSITFISAEQRQKIIYTTMSLYFRTPKFLNLHNNMTDEILDFAVKYADKETGIVKFKIENIDHEFHISDYEKVKQDFKAKNKLTFLLTHLEVWHDFVKYKFKCGFSVYKISPEYELISSDNPVIIRSAAGNPFNIFDPTNIIQLPLDRYHMLTIFPNTEGGMTDRIFREERDRWSSLILGLQVEENSENVIFGYPGTIEKHDFNQKKYGEHNEENLKSLEDLKVRAFETMKLLKIMDRFGFPSPAVAAKVKQMRKMPEFKDDPSLNNIVLELAKKGYLTV